MEESLGGLVKLSWNIDNHNEIMEWREKAKKWDEIKNDYNNLKDGYVIHDMQSKAVLKWKDKANRLDKIKDILNQD